MLLTLSKFEQTQFDKQRQKLRQRPEEPQTTKQQVQEFPGRVVSVNAALLRMRYKGMSLEDACLTPNESKKKVKS